MANTAKQNHSESTVTVLPQSDERTLCVKLHGAVTREDYDQFFFKKLQAFVDQKIPFGLLIDYSDYEGWHKDAAARSFESIIDHGKFARKMAYVAAPDSKTRQIEVARPLLLGDVKFFKTGELDQAIAWVKAD